MTDTPQTLGSKRARGASGSSEHAHREITRNQLLAHSAVSTVPPNLQSTSEPAVSIFSVKTLGRHVDIENSFLPERQQKKRACSLPRFSEARFRIPLPSRKGPCQAVSEPS